MWRPLGRLCAEYYGIMHYPRGSLWLGDGGIYPPLVGVQIRDREYWVIDYDLTAANFLRHTEPDIPMSYPYRHTRGNMWPRRVDGSIYTGYSIVRNGPGRPGHMVAGLT